MMMSAMKRWNEIKNKNGDNNRERNEKIVSSITQKRKTDSKTIFRKKTRRLWLQKKES